MSLKENLQIQTSGAALAAQESAYKFKTWFLSLYTWQRALLWMLLLLLLPGSLLIRYGLELVLVRQYAQQAVVAQPAFSNPDPISQSKVNLIQNSIGTTSAYAVIKNPNLDLAVEQLRYTMTFLNSRNQPVQTATGTIYLLPDQQRWLVVPRIESADPIVSAELKFVEPVWQKRLSLQEVELRMTEPYTYQQESPYATVTEGAVINNSPFDLRQVTLVLVLYGSNNEVLAVTSREEFTLKPYERRAYIIQWPGIDRSQVNRIGLESYTNTLDPANLTVSAN